MGVLIKEKWAEILVLIILIPFVVWSVNNTIDTGARIAVQESRTQQIIASLPELRTRVAHETIYGNFATALLVSDPFMKDSEWMTEIQLLNATNGQVTRYLTKMVDEDDTRQKWAIYGMSMTKDDRAMSFRAMENMATTVQVKTMVPPGIDPDASFVSSVPASEIQGVLGQVGAIERDIESAPGVRNWPSLMDSATTGALKPKQY